MTLSIKRRTRPFRSRLDPRELHEPIGGVRRILSDYPSLLEATDADIAPDGVAGRLEASEVMFCEKRRFLHWLFFL